MGIQIPKLLYYGGKPVSSEGIKITPEEANKILQEVEKQVEKNKRVNFK